MTYGQAYGDQFITNLNHLFNTQIIDPQATIDGEIDVTQMWRQLGYRIVESDEVHDYHINHQTHVLTINRDDDLTRQRFHIAKALGQLVYQHASQEFANEQTH